MIKFLNDIRNAEKPISNNRKIINTIAVLFLGIALGTFSKFLDFRQAELPSVLMAIDGALDVHNFLGRFAIWVLIALCISIYSNSAIRASINVFAFFIGMVASYYLYSNYIAGFFPRSYAVIWFGFTAVSPLLSFACWYARGESKLALILSALILAVLFNMCFVYANLSHNLHILRFFVLFKTIFLSVFHLFIIYYKFLPNTYDFPSSDHYHYIPRYLYKHSLYPYFTVTGYYDILFP